MIYRKEETYKNNWHDKGADIFDQEMSLKIFVFAYTGEAKP